MYYFYFIVLYRKFSSIKFFLRLLNSLQSGAMLAIWTRFAVRLKLEDIKIINKQVNSALNKSRNFKTFLTRFFTFLGFINRLIILQSPQNYVRHLYKVMNKKFPYIDDCYLTAYYPPWFAGRMFRIWTIKTLQTFANLTIYLLSVGIYYSP